ncbi:hypothetical protein BH11GEM2_BH11GEM2_11700 [soil metagenome]|jgi:hypothetical protein
MAGNGVLSEARKAQRAEMRRATLHLVSAVVALDAVAIATWYVAIMHATDRTKSIYVGAWTIATAFVVAIFLKRVRKARYVRTSP